VRIEANIDEGDVGKVTVGQKATIVLRNGDRVPAHVTRISPSVRQVQNDVRTFAVTLAIDGPAQPFRSGMSVDVEIVVRATRNCLSVPAFAVFEDKGGKRYVYVVQNGRAVKRAITKGVEGIERVEASSGVKEGDLIVTSLEARGLRDGARVKATLKKEEAPRREDEGRGSRGTGTSRR